MIRTATRCKITIRPALPSIRRWVLRMNSARHAAVWLWGRDTSMYEIRVGDRTVEIGDGDIHIIEMRIDRDQIMALVRRS